MLRRRFMVLLAATVFMFTASCRKVPDLAGKTQADAEKLLAKRKLKLGQVTMKATGKAAAGTVVDQDPKAGSKPPEDKTVAIVLEQGGAVNPPADGAATVAVPNVVGKTQAEAEAALDGAGLARGELSVAMSDQPDGTVFEQDPPAGFQAARGTAVNLKIASNSLVTVPNVVGQQQAAATQALQAAQLAVAQPVPVAQLGGVDGAVIEQNPSAGLRVAKGSPVVLKIKQPTVQVPRVVGLTEDDACLRLFRAGLAPVVGHRYNRTEPEVVISQSVAENTLLPRNSDVGLTVSSRRLLVRPPYRKTANGVISPLTGADAIRFRSLIIDR